MPGEGRLRRRRPSSRQGSGQRRGRLELTLSSGCVKSGLGFFPDKNAKSLESFEERIFLSSSFPLGLKFHKKLLCDYCDRASRREWQLKIGGLAEISWEKLGFTPFPPSSFFSPFSPSPRAVVTFRVPERIWPLPGGLGSGPGQAQGLGLGSGLGQGAGTAPAPKGERGPGSAPRSPGGCGAGVRRAGPGSGARCSPAASPFPRRGGQRGARLGRGCPG